MDIINQYGGKTDPRQTEIMVKLRDKYNLNDYKYKGKKLCTKERFSEPQLYIVDKVREIINENGGDKDDLALLDEYVKNKKEKMEKKEKGENYEPKKQTPKK